MLIEDQIGVGDIQLEQEEKAHLQEVIESNRLSYGPKIKKFEEKIASEHDCKFGVFCNSGTSALQVSLKVLKDKYDWKDGDEVIVPSTTFIATSNIVLQSSMKPVFVDAHPETYNINPKLIEDKITDKTRCIIPVHLFGQPCNMDSILNIADKYNLKIIEDSAETMFASYKDKKVGSFGSFGCFSTYIAHFLVTGVGGIITTNNSELAEIARSVVNHGRDTSYISIDDDKEDNDLSEVVKKRFSFVRMGYSYRATELEAAIGLGQLEKKEDIINSRRKNAHYYRDKLSSLSKYLKLPTELKDRNHNFMMFPILIRGENKRDLVNYLERNNIETRDMPTTINQPYYQRLFDKSLDDFPVTKDIVDKGFYIGCHQYITKQEREYIVNKIKKFFK